MTTEKPLIIVGNDGSKAAEPALHWALQHARAVGGTVQVVRGWSMRTAPRPETQTFGHIPPIDDFETAVLKDLEHDCAEVVADYADVEVEYLARRGPAANALLDCAAEADLIVVGARGLGGFQGLALGSVSDQVSRHAACPVVIVRNDTSADTERSLPRE
ncbi:universal stress protein [Nocardioides sp. cx-169]|uniref:universal stress protein n=1 Tax=Nocardioides sp. cx-169 TaxID=2899080 RepID=UPI001E4B8CD6|nr:universal stress protein [Nocardioides sp. cx-169]MCD4532488.1 universal stress protein [Nocardioides sp. cx-169]